MLGLATARESDEYFVGLESFRKAASYPEWWKFLLGTLSGLAQHWTRLNGLLAPPMPLCKSVMSLKAAF